MKLSLGRLTVRVGGRGLQHLQNAYKNYMNGHKSEMKNQRTIGPENAHLKPDPRVLSHQEMTLTLNTHTPLLNS